MNSKNVKMKQLRERAEAILDKKTDRDKKWVGESEQIINDLQVYQIELEIQNEELLRTQEALEKARDNYADLYNFAPVGYLTLEETGIILQANRTISTMLGYDAADITGKFFADYMHDGDREIFLGRFNAFYKNPEGKSMDLRFMRSNGSIFYAHLVGRMVFGDKKPVTGRLLVVINDITEQKLAEIALEESEVRFSRLLDHAPVPIAWYSMKGELGYLNHEYTRRFGYSVDDIKTFDDFLRQAIPDEEQREESLDRWQREVRLANEEGRGIVPAEYTIMTKDGREKIVEVSGIRMDKQLIVTFVDITERKQGEEKLAHSLEEKTLLMQELQHRVINSLVMISNFINLEEAGNSDPNIRKVLKDLNSRVTSFAELYSLLNKSSNVNQLQLDAYIKNIVAHIRKSAIPDEKKVKIKEEYTGLTVNTDSAVSWGLIVNELITNSLKYAFEGQGDNTISVKLDVVDNEVILEVSDNGKPLPEDFDIEKSGGTGIFLVKLLVQHLRGDFNITRGSWKVFSVTAPGNVQQN
jgi:PAS domain S-box-containing protein